MSHDAEVLSNRDDKGGIHGFLGTLFVLLNGSGIVDDVISINQSLVGRFVVVSHAHLNRP